MVKNEGSETKASDSIAKCFLFDLPTTWIDSPRLITRQATFGTTSRRTGCSIARASWGS